MDVEIVDKRSRLYISEGDIFEDALSSSNVYLAIFCSFNDTNKTVYKLTSLSGSNAIFDDKELNEEEIKHCIYNNKLVHYSRDQYCLKLAKKEE